MVAIMNSELHSVEVNGLFHQLNLEEMESTSGGNTLIPLWDSNSQDLYFSTFPNDRFYNNKFLAIDFSNLNVYLLI
jgi:hypothetical protein